MLINSLFLKIMMLMKLSDNKQLMSMKLKC